MRGLALTKAPKDSAYEAHFINAMNDDFNTPEALAALFDLARDINIARDNKKEAKASSLGALLKKLANGIGLLEGGDDEIENWFKGADVEGELNSDAIDTLVQERLDAKANKDWGLADKIRDDLQAQEIALEDNGAETIWRRS
jgi:cysteinyl-tRNA synthetase